MGLYNYDIYTMDYDKNFFISIETKLTDERRRFTRLETFMTSNIVLNQIKTTGEII